MTEDNRNIKLRKISTSKKASSKKSLNKSSTKTETKRSEKSVNKNKENVNFINQNIMNVSHASNQLRDTREKSKNNETRNKLNDPTILTASFNQKKVGLHGYNSKTLHTPNFESYNTSERKQLNESYISKSDSKPGVDTNMLIKLIKDLQKKTKKTKRVAKSNYIKDVTQHKGNYLSFKDFSAARRNRHSRSFTINVNKNNMSNVHRIFNAMSNSRSAASCHDTINHSSESDEIKKLRTKHRREMMYMKKNAAKKIKMILKQ